MILRICTRSYERQTYPSRAYSKTGPPFPFAVLNPACPVELIGDFFAEYPATAGSDKVDTDEADEVIDAVAKTVAELTSQQDGVTQDARLHYDEFRLKRRRQQPALARSIDGDSDRVEYGTLFDPTPNLDAGQSAFGAAPIRRVSPRTSIFQNDAIAACSF